MRAAEASDSKVGEQLNIDATKRRVITIPAPAAGIVKIGDDCGGLAPNNLVVERIGEQFTDDKGWLVVDVTLAERMGE
jgi:hypothetical protein